MIAGFCRISVKGVIGSVPPIPGATTSEPSPKAWLAAILAAAITLWANGFAIEVRAALEPPPPVTFAING